MRRQEIWGRGTERWGARWEAREEDKMVQIQRRERGWRRGGFREDRHSRRRTMIMILERRRGH